MKKDKIIEAAEALNTTGLSSIKVITTNITEDDLVELFMRACEKVTPADEEKLPEVVWKTYNDLEAILSQSAEPPKEREKSESRPMVVPKKSDKTFEGMQRYLLSLDMDKAAITNVIARLILDPIDENDLFKEIMDLAAIRGLKQFQHKGNIVAHINYMRKVGWIITKEDGKYHFIGKGQI